MVFYSILSSEADGHLNREFAQRPPAYFIDLNLDKIIDAITAGHEPDDIKPFFYTPLKYLEDIYYRQDIMQDVAKSDLYQALVEYTAGIKRSVQLVAKPENRYYHFQQQRWALEGMLLYCQQVTTLSDTLEKAALSSCGMMNFKHYLAQYTAGAAFTDLYAAAKTIKNKLDHIQYSLNINGDTIVVAHYEQQPNYSDEIINVFEKFKQRDVTTDLAFRRRDGMMNHIEAQILDCVARLFPAEFTELDSFIENNRGYHDPALDKFAHEIQFYLAVVEYIKKFQQSGLPFCIPEILTHNKDISAGGAFDLALAATVLQRLC
ncbi:hypothetical protein F9C28_04215 [Shimwellia pseudoproteus]|uniref:hypothetical protein n=1 Tax=Shimwellia pseudoproteus TaxID=570012 RepID=UPI0018EAE5DB|nr:hypothetical protein [Shimwellia pseudoproteus]MBJ3814157.1 hypothetical protein [Shimwellia pseudoproteus]